MRVPLSWIKDYIDIDTPPIEIAKILTMAGLEVDAIEPIEFAFSGIVVGKVITTEKHPDADKLCVATVTDGTETFQVVCGAPNCRPGLITAFAKVGATLPDDSKPFKIKKSKIRGVESLGMLCSEKELRLSDSDEGIIEFDTEEHLGKDLAEVYSDVIFEISLTPNLGHCANILGIARELHAKTEVPLKIPEIVVNENETTGVDKLVKVNVEDATLCPRYACRIIKDVTIAPSPRWMQNRLIASGLRPINNIVDITNYVLLELGQPLHAFDFNLIEDAKITVRNATEREPFTTLDGQERILHHEDLLICDGKTPVALAGVMGGKSSEVHEGTKNILLESAYFSPSCIRATSKRLGLMTDASRRFERGSDPNMVTIALDRAAMLMNELAGGTIVKGVIDVKTGDFKELVVLCRVSHANKIIGTQLSIGEIENIFQRLGFKYTWDGEDTFTVVVPTYRVDISAEIDLIEEIARIYGYENLHTPITPFRSSKYPHSEVFLFERKIRARMLTEGLQEFLTCDLIGPKLLEMVHGPIMSEDSLIRVLNPTSIEQSCLRTSLLPGLLQVVKYNYDHQNQDISGFEIGRSHFEEGSKYHEESIVGIILTGKVHPHHWNNKPRDVDFYDLKGVVESLLSGLGIESCQYKNTKLPQFHSGRQASIFANSLEIGSLGELHPAILRRLDIPQRILFAEFNLHDLYNLKKDVNKLESIPKFPSSERDWTLTVKEALYVDTIFDHISSIESPLLENFILLDIYRSDKIGEGLKNVTVRFSYRDSEKTVSQETVDREHTRITDRVRSLLTN